VGSDPPRVFAVSVNGFRYHYSRKIMWFLLDTFSLLEPAGSRLFESAESAGVCPPPDVVLIRDSTAAAAFSKTLGFGGASPWPLFPDEKEGKTLFDCVSPWALFPDEKEGKNVEREGLTLCAGGALTCFGAAAVVAGCP
jgi:hypothetical protein